MTRHTEQHILGKFPARGVAQSWPETLPVHQFAGDGFIRHAHEWLQLLLLSCLFCCGCTWIYYAKYATLPPHTHPNTHTPAHTNTHSSVGKVLLLDLILSSVSAGNRLFPWAVCLPFANSSMEQPINFLIECHCSS